MSRFRIAALLATAALACAQESPPKKFELKGDRFKPLIWEQMTPAQKKMITNVLAGERRGTGGLFNVTLRDPKWATSRRTSAHTFDSIPRCRAS